MADGQTGGTFGGSGWTRRRALRGLAALGTVGVPAVSGGARATGSAGVRNVGQESPDGWAQGAKLVADDAESGDSFGTSVAVSGSTTVVGADGDENGDGLAAGAAYAFEDDDGWRQSAKLLPDRKRGEDQYGRSVAVSGSTAVAGAFGDGGPGGEFRGAAYTFAGPGDDRSVGVVATTRRRTDRAARRPPARVAAHRAWTVTPEPTTTRCWAVASGRSRPSGWWRRSGERPSVRTGSGPGGATTVARSDRADGPRCGSTVSLVGGKRPGPHGVRGDGPRVPWGCSADDAVRERVASVRRFRSGLL